MSGIMGAIDRFIHPTNPLGQLGKYISQASGGLFGDVYNAADSDALAQQQQAMQRQQYALQMAKLQQPDIRTVGDQLLSIPQGGGAPSVLFSGQRKPTALQQNAEYLNTVKPGLGNTYLENQANPLIGIDVQGPDGSVTRQFYPRGGVPGGLGAPGAAPPPIPPASGLVPQPLPQGYKIRGGASPSGSRGFP